MEEAGRAEATIAGLSTYGGSLLIERAETSADHGPPGVIESMEFRVRLCLPDG